MTQRIFMTLGAFSFFSFLASVTLARSFYFLEGFSDITGECYTANSDGSERKIVQALTK
jgi:hypothetical protein